MKKNALALIVLLIIIIWPGYKAKAPIGQMLDAKPKIEDTEEVAITEVKKDLEVPASIDHQAIFVVQTPLGSWDVWHEEACEEASMLIASYWYKNETIIPSPSDLEHELQAIGRWERENLGTDVSTTIAQVKDTLTGYAGVSSTDLTLVDIKSVNDLKRLLNEGLIIAPFSGKDLHNPHFKNGGPRYHMAVITGYLADEFILQEVGTRYGQDYRYGKEVLLGAIHDFVPEGDIKTGKKVVLQIKKAP